MVTAELAVGLPALLMVLLTALTAVAATGEQLRCFDAAAGAARLAARGQAAAVTAFVRVDGPPGATSAVRYGDQLVTVSVTARLRLPVAGATFPLTVTGAATEPVEPGVPLGGPGAPTTATGHGA